MLTRQIPDCHPHLLRFLEDNGTFLSNNHTPLIAHTGHPGPRRRRPDGGLQGRHPLGGAPGRGRLAR
jgi:hypothetical protein